jgi:hypothetical protein
VLFLTGTVHAAPLAQTVVPALEVPEWLAGFGIGAVVLYILSRIIASIATARQPAGIQDTLKQMAEVQSKAEDNRSKEIELEERRRADQVARDAKRDEQESRRAEQTDRMLDQLNKDHQRMHDNEAAHMQEVRAEVEAKRELKSEVVGYHEEVKALAMELNAELLRLTARITAVENSTVATSRRIGTDDSVASIQAMIAQLVTSINRLIELAAHPPTIPVPVPVSTEVKPNATSNDSSPTIHPNATAGDASAGANTGSDGTADASDNPQ